MYKAYIYMHVYSLHTVPITNFDVPRKGSTVVLPKSPVSETSTHVQGLLQQGSLLLLVLVGVDEDRQDRGRWTRTS